MVHDDTPDAVLPIAVIATASASGARDGYPASVRFYAPDSDEPLAPAPYVRLRWRYRQPGPVVRVALPSGSDDRIGVVLEFDTPKLAAEFAAQLADVAACAIDTPRQDDHDECDHGPF